MRTASRPPFWISLLSGNLAQSDAAFRTRRFPENELDLLLRRALEVAPGNGIIIDGGANIGFVSLTAASLGFRVKAFEPVGLHRQKLSTSICLNAYDKIELIGKGLSDRPTILRPVNYAEATQLRNISWEDCVKRNRHSHLRKDAESDEGNCGENFEITTLDESLTTEDIQNVYFLKLDIEGHEVKAFAGASNLLKSKSLKYIHFEWCPSMIRSIGSDPMDAFSILDTNGFACRFEKDAVSGTDSAVIEPAAGAVQLDDGQVKENFLCVRKS